MMNSVMRDQLLRVGLGSEEKVQELEEADRAREDMRSRLWETRLTEKKSRPPIILDELISAKSVREFRRVALHVLLTHPETVGEVIEATHIMKSEPSGKSLVWQIYQIRDGLAKVGDDGRDMFLRQALGQNGLGYLNAMKAMK